jgi:predicted ribosomally synthesized peptide with SipW-like signal peptide
MKNIRKWLMLLGIMLSLAIATGGTLAFLTDTDSDVNV